MSLTKYIPGVGTHIDNYQWVPGYKENITEDQIEMNKEEILQLIKQELQNAGTGESGISSESIQQIQQKLTQLSNSIDSNKSKIEENTQKDAQVRTLLTDVSQKIDANTLKDNQDRALITDAVSKITDVSTKLKSTSDSVSDVSTKLKAATTQINDVSTKLNTESEKITKINTSIGEIKESIPSKLSEMKNDMDFVSFDEANTQLEVKPGKA